MRKAISVALTLVMAMITLSLYAQAPQSGVYRIQNVGSQKYIKVNGRYDATPNQASQQDASYITVGIEKKLDDGTYKVNSLASTYGDDNTRVEVYDYITKALTLGEIELRKILANSSDENVQRAINTMHQIAKEYGFMRMMPVDGQADTYHAVAVLPVIPDSVVTEWRKKVSEQEFPGEMWDWCKQLVLNYLQEHEGPGGTDPGLISKIRNNLALIYEGHTYLLKDDNDGSFGFIDTGKNGPRTSDSEFSMWKLTPKVNNENVKDGTYKVRNIGNKKYVQIRSKYYATPDAEEGAASDIRITFDGEANGGQKIVNLGGQDPNGNDIDIYSYVEKAIFIGKMAIYDVLTEGTESNPASPENIVVAQEFMENFVKKNAFMCIKPVEDNDEAVYAYATIPHIPENVIYQMKQHGAIEEESEQLAWEFGVQKVKDYLDDHSGQGGTDNTLRSYILANIDKIRPGVTYYLGAEDNGTFDYFPKFAEGEGWNRAIVDNFNEIEDNTYFQWGFDVEEVEEDNLTSGTYQIRNVEYKNYVHVISKYYAKPDADGKEVKATDIHITYSGKLDDGSYKVTNMSAVAEDGSQVDILSYVDKAIKLGKIAIADVLDGKSTDENIKKAQDYMEQFVRENAFMRVKPVAGTNYVYAIATIPEIPYDVYHEMYRHGVITEDTKEAAWTYGVNYVLSYLNTHGTDNTLAQLIRNNINKIQQGHTYYLSEDSDGSFGYKDYDLNEVDLADKTLQWGIDLEEEDQPVESDFYKIHNVGNDKYVKVEGRYYARPAYTEEEATPIAVTIAEGQLEDGSYKVTNLAGDGQDIQKYVDHAIELGNALIDQLLDDVSSDVNIERAKNAMEQFVRENAYMRVKLVPGETEAYYAYVVLPTVPDSIVAEWQKKYPNYDGTMRDWAVDKVIEYLDNHPQVDGKLASMVRNNIEKLYEGHTYYLRADGDDTFGIGDFTNGEVTLTDRHYWWGFADAIKAEPVNGYFRIKGADGNYVNVTGKFAAAPDADETTAKSAAGTVIYVGTGETKDTKTLPLEILRSQGVDVGSKSESAYMNMINDVMLIVANTIADIATSKIEENENYSQYAGLVKPMVQTLLESVDLNLYIEPTITSDGKNAYMLEVNIPDLNEYCGLAQDALSLMGKHGSDLVDNLEALKKGDGGVLDKLISAAQEMVVMLDHGNSAADEIWALLKQKGKTFLNSYNEQLSALLPEQALTFINNALNNPDFNYGTTYCLRQDADGTFGYASRESLINDDAAKWILEPFDTEDPNYDADTYVPFVAKTKFGQEDYVNISEENGGGIQEGDTHYFTTIYLDFEAQIETTNAVAYTVTSTERKDFNKNDGTTKVYYLAHLSDPISVIPAATPVVLRSDADGEIELRPVGEPTHPAVESAEFLALKEQLLDIFRDKIGNMTTHNAPSIRAISETTDDNILVGSFFGEEIDEMDANTYLALGDKKKVESGSPALDMDGLGFWKDNVSELEGNTAYLYGDGQVDFKMSTTFDNATVGKAPGYIFQYKDSETYTSIKDVTTLKEVKSVRYYNSLGIESATPFEGVNIIVTTFTDGTKATTKVIK